MSSRYIPVLETPQVLRTGAIKKGGEIRVENLDVVGIEDFAIACCPDAEPEVVQALEILYPATFDSMFGGDGLVSENVYVLVRNYTVGAAVRPYMMPRLLPQTNYELRPLKVCHSA
jgi:hypothetical protein